MAISNFYGFSESNSFVGDIEVGVVGLDERISENEYVLGGIESHDTQLTLRFSGNSDFKNVLIRS